MEGFEHSPFSRPFNNLRYLGAWVVDRYNKKKISRYATYKVFMGIIALYFSFMLLKNLYIVREDFKKITWNLCISTLFIGQLFKVFLLFTHNVELDTLRRCLHSDFTNRTNPVYNDIHNLSLRYMQIAKRGFYIGACTFIPVWAVVRLTIHFWGAREWPIPVELPFEVDRKNDFNYLVVFFCLILISLCGIYLAMEFELAMFSILIQLTREYMVLLKDLRDVNNISFILYNTTNTNVEFNQELRQCKIKVYIKEISRRQQRIIQYVQVFEICFNKALLIHIFGISILMIVSAIQCMMESGNDPENLVYQIGYLCIVLFDTYMVCWFGTRLRAQCLEVGKEAYFLKWYKMSDDIRKELCMIIRRSQNPPKITSGKFMEMNLHTFIILMRNIYSWLTLFQRLAFKTNEDNDK